MLFLSDIDPACFASGRSRPPIKDKKGGLTPYGRRYYREKHGNNLKKGVTRKGKKMSVNDMRRKSSFLMRFYGNKNKPPLAKPNGSPTRQSLAAAAWGERPPRTQAQADALYQKGKRLNERYKKLKLRKND